MLEREIRLDDVMPLIKEKLASGQEVIFSPHGTSMLPFLKEGRDSITLKAPPARLKKYDIPLYQRKNGQYILHRVVRVGETYTCVGDNQFALETGVEHDQIIAVCAAVKRNSKPTRSINRPIWRIYAVLWNYTRFPRRIFAAIFRRIKKIFK